jgi:hypothetical protein
MNLINYLILYSSSVIVYIVFNLLIIVCIVHLREFRIYPRIETSINGQWLLIIYLYRKRARIASEDIAGDTGRNEKFNIERISKTDRVAPESTTELNAFTSDD